ncbi:MAG: hypothetical protein JNM63_13730 [Spirochaetia bacterium]|nr:hypothetical protein [Spirochaetia bacterium]
MMVRAFKAMKFPGETWFAMVGLLASFILFLLIARMGGKVVSRIVDIVLWDGLFSRIPGAFFGLALMVFALNGLQILFLDFFPVLSFPEKTRFQSLLFAIADHSRLWVLGR